MVGTGTQDKSGAKRVRIFYAVVYDDDICFVLKSNTQAINLIYFFISA